MTLEEGLKSKEKLRLEYKEQHGIMTQQEREAKLKQAKIRSGGNNVVA